MKKRFFIFAVVLPLLLLAACSKSSDTLQNLSDMELESNQTLITGQVTSRVGNDIELAIGTLASAQGPGDMGGMPSGMPSGEAGAMPSFDAGSMPSGGPENSSGFSGYRRQTDDASGQAADGNLPDGTSQGSSQDGTAAGSAEIQLSGETMSLTIPVGTRVLVTSNGTLIASSFGRIQADDILQLILKTRDDGSQVVIEAQIME